MSDLLKRTERRVDKRLERPLQITLLDHKVNSGNISPGGVYFEVVADNIELFSLGRTVEFEILAKTYRDKAHLSWSNSVFSEEQANFIFKYLNYSSEEQRRIRDARPSCKQESLENLSERHTQKLNTCWQRNKRGGIFDPNYGTEIVIHGGEPYDSSVPSTPGQIYHAPYLSDTDTLEARSFQNVVAY